MNERNDNPKDSAETLRIMADLERYADMHAPTLSDSADVMDEARHRLAVLQQFANGQGVDARIRELEAANAALVAECERLREAVKKVLPWLEREVRPLYAGVGADGFPIEHEPEPREEACGISAMVLRAALAQPKEPKDV